RNASYVCSYRRIRGSRRGTRMQAVWIPFIALAALGGPATAPVEDFTLRDHRGAERRLSDWQDSRLVVIAFLGVDCPLVKRYELRDVACVGVNANAQDGVGDVARYVRAHQISFPLLKDVGNLLADRLGATRTPEVFVLDERRVVRYRGRIDDQYIVGTQRSAP